MPHSLPPRRSSVLCGQERLSLGEGEARPNFQVHFDRLPATADYVAQVIRENYPTLQIPYHARWRHFAAQGVDRWGQLAAGLKGVDADERSRLRFAQTGRAQCRERVCWCV